MNKKESNEKRRKLLKSIAAGSGAVIAGKSLPESWSRPVVDSVILPAHAQTSGQTVYSIDLAAAPSNPTGAICVTTDGNVADITLWFDITPGQDQSRFEATGVPIGSTSLTPMTLIENTCGFSDACAVSCVSVNGIASGEFEFTISGAPPAPIGSYDAPVAACIPAPPATCPTSAPASAWRS